MAKPVTMLTKFILSCSHGIFGKSQNIKIDFLNKDSYIQMHNMRKRCQFGVKTEKFSDYRFQIIF